MRNPFRRKPYTYQIVRNAALVYAIRRSDGRYYHPELSERAMYPWIAPTQEEFPGCWQYRLPALHEIHERLCRGTTEGLHVLEDAEVIALLELDRDQGPKQGWGNSVAAGSAKPRNSLSKTFY